MTERDKKINTPVSVISQLTILISQLLFLIVLVSGFSFISVASMTAYERSLSSLYEEGLASLLND